MKLMMHWIIMAFVAANTLCFIYLGHHWWSVAAVVICLGAVLQPEE